MRRTATVLLLVGYIAGVMAVTLFPIAPHPPSYWAGDPWWTMIHYIPFMVDAPSFILNIIMFIPYGVLVPLIWPRTDSYRRSGALGVAASAAIELAQLIIMLTIGSRRTVDVNDLIANTAGALAGLWLLRLAVPGAAHRAALAGPRSLTQPGSLTQPDLVAQPGSLTQPDLVAQPGSLTRPDLVAQPGSLTRPGLDKRPGLPNQPDPLACPGLPNQAGPVTEPGSVDGSGSVRRSAPVHGGGTRRSR
ncbi:VanZ family protein [Micromonosporaceae bacterium Da 78-11]